MELRLRLALDLRKQQLVSSTKLHTPIERDGSDSQVAQSAVPEDVVPPTEENGRTGGRWESPTLSEEAWKAYLRRRETVTGLAGPMTTLDVWDFH